jgi:hypothetical protein
MFRAGRRGRALLALLPYSRVRATDVAGCRTEIHVSRSNARGEAPEGSCHTALKSGLAADHLHAAIWQGPRHLYCVGTCSHETKMSADSSTSRPVWPWGKPLPRFRSPEEEQTFWATHEVEGPPREIGDVAVSAQSRWVPRARPLSWAGWAGLGGAVGAVLGSLFGVPGAAVGGGVGAGLVTYMLAMRSGREQRSS